MQISLFHFDLLALDSHITIVDCRLQDKKVCRTGGMQDRRDAGQEGCRTGGMQDRSDAGQEG